MEDKKKEELIAKLKECKDDKKSMPAEKEKALNLATS